MIVNIAGSKRVSTRNPMLAKVSPGCDAGLKLSIYYIEAWSQKRFARANLGVAIHLRHCLTLLVHLRLPIFLYVAYARASVITGLDCWTGLLL